MSCARRFVTLALTLLPSALVAQWGQITFTKPANGLHVGSSSLAVQWKGCSNTWDQQTYATSVGFTQFTTTQSTVNCPEWTYHHLYSATVTLAYGDNTIRAEFCNSQESPTCIDTTVLVHYDPAIRVTPKGDSASTNKGVLDTARFYVRNSGGFPDTAQMTAICGGILGTCTVTPVKAYLNAGDSVLTLVTFTPSDTGAATLKLRGAMIHASIAADTGYYNVVIPKKVASVVLTPVGFTTIGTSQTTNLIARTYASDGTELRGRRMTWTGNSQISVSNGDTLSPAGVTATGSAAGSGVVTAASEGVSGTSTITVTTSNFLSASTAGLNPGATIERSDCLAIAIGNGAAYECGDLRMIHELPMTITMGKARVPTLIYNSAHAKARAWLAANFLYQGTTPDSIVATATINGTPYTETFAWSSLCATQACRVVIPIQVDTTIVWPASLTISAKKSGATLQTSSTIDVLP